MYVQKRCGEDAPSHGSTVFAHSSFQVHGAARLSDNSAGTTPQSLIPVDKV